MHKRVTDHTNEEVYDATSLVTTTDSNKHTRSKFTYYHLSTDYFYFTCAAYACTRSTNLFKIAKCAEELNYGLNKNKHAVRVERGDYRFRLLEVIWPDLYAGMI